MRVDDFDAKKIEHAVATWRLDGREPDQAVMQAAGRLQTKDPKNESLQSLALMLNRRDRF